MHDLFTRLARPRKLVIGMRQLKIAEYLLQGGTTEFEFLAKQLEKDYQAVANPRKALVRDLNYLRLLGAIRISKDTENKYYIEPLLDWPTKMTESEFFNKVKQLPKAKSHSFLSAS